MDLLKDVLLWQYLETIPPMTSYAIVGVAVAGASYMAMAKTPGATSMDIKPVALGVGVTVVANTLGLGVPMSMILGSTAGLVFTIPFA